MRPRLRKTGWSSRQELPGVNDSDLPKLGFPKQRRLLNAQQFQRVFDEVECKQGGKYFTFLSRSNPQAQCRLGIVVAKRHVKSAAHRNAIKRRIRETFRHSVPCDAGFDVIVLAKPACAGLAITKLSAELTKQWSDLLRKRKPSTPNTPAVR